MKKDLIISIIINNYNYSRYLRQAIDSAIDQTYPDTEVIIVDDGSTDGSQIILEEYQRATKICLKENGGQGSAFNAGYKISRGEIIVFLDADDLLLPEACQIIADTFDFPSISKAHWPLHVIDEIGNRKGELTPKQNLPEGELIDKLTALGPNAYLSPPTSGNAWSRQFLEQILPMPETAFRISADNYLCMLAPVYGKIKTIDQPLSLYRLHGKNNFRGKRLDESLLLSKVDRFESSCAILAGHLTSSNFQFKLENWVRHSWLKKLQQSLSDIKSIVPENERFILADDSQWQMEEEIAGRRIIPFKEHNSQYWGPPADDLDAISEIEKQITKGTKFLFFAWPAFWWLDHYRQLREYLNQKATCVIRDERLVGFKLIQNN